MVHYIEPFIEVCTTVFQDLSGIEIRPGRPYIAEKDSTKEWDISTVIGLAGEAVGAVVISMKNGLALRLAEKLTGAAQEDIGDDVVDVLGEIANIIAGKAKQRLESSCALVISLPTIVRGKGHIISWPGKQPRIVCIPFKIFDDETFNLSVTLEATEK
jgi:chemotaxis protein CheX